MATVDELAALRRAIAELVDTDPYTDLYLGTIIDALGVDQSAATIWTQKAAEYASLVNVSESGSSRSLSDLHKNALAMAASFRGLGAGVVTGGTPYTVQVERP